MKIVIDGAEVSAESVQGKIDGLCATRDALKTANDTLTAKLAEATDPAKLAALVETEAQKKFDKRVADEAEAKKVADAKALADANLAKAKAAFPTIDGLETKSADYIQCLCDRIEADKDGLQEMRGGAKGTEAPAPKTENDAVENDADVELSPREAARLANVNAWKNLKPGVSVAGV